MSSDGVFSLALCLFMSCPIDICHSELVEESLFARRSPAAGDDFKRDLAGIPLLFVMRDELKRDMPQIPLLFVSMLELCWGLESRFPLQEGNSKSCPLFLRQSFLFSTGKAMTNLHPR